MHLAIAAVIAENAMVHEFSSENIQISPEILVPRLGDHLVKRGTVSESQLARALQIQKLENQKGNYKLLGRILIEQGFLDQSMLDAAITEQIVNLQNALRQSNNELEDRVRERTLELQQALNRITQLNRLKTNFISNISHELRTPLAHMIGYLELLRDSSLGPLTEDQNHAVSVLLKSYNRLYNLIDELLQFSMLSQGEMSLSQESVSLKDLLEKATTYTQSFAAENKVELKIISPSDLVSVVVDEEKMSWVLGELIENGVKFNQPGGYVVVDVRAENGLVLFRITDNGIGIKQEHLTEIYEPFHQLDGSSTRRSGGTGIGLTLAKQIIESHGSSLMVESSENKGTSFQFSVPQAN
jgi:signal transduction histidine kinase